MEWFGGIKTKNGTTGCNFKLTHYPLPNAIAA